MAGKTQMGDLIMTREEAIKKIKEAMPTMWKETKEAIQTVIPEFFENENEMMVRRIESFLSAYGLDYFTKDELLEVENWLEKQKEEKSAECGEEDERIRMVLCDIVRDMPYMETELRAHGLTVEKTISYLEKRKEENPSIFPPGFGEVRWNPISSVQQKPVDTLTKDQYVEKFRSLCDSYEIKLPNRTFDIYHLCDDLAELFGNADNQKSSSYDHEMWKNCEANFEGGKKEVIEHPEKYGLMKNQPPKVNIGHFKSFMMQYLQEAANRKDDSEIEADTDKWAIKLLSLVDAEAVNPVCLDEDTELGLDRALQVVKSAKGNLQGYQSDDGIYECDHAIGVLENILNNGIVQKVTEWNEEDEKVIKKVCNFLEANRIKGGLELISMSDITRLNNLRYKYAWKPDDTDMGYLKSIIDRVPLTCREQGALERIYNGLVSH